MHVGILFLVMTSPCPLNRSWWPSCLLLQCNGTSSSAMYNTFSLLCSVLIPSLSTWSHLSPALQFHIRHLLGHLHCPRCPHHSSSNGSCHLFIGGHYEVYRPLGFLPVWPKSVITAPAATPPDCVISLLILSVSVKLSFFSPVLNPNLED